MNPINSKENPFIQLAQIQAIEGLIKPKQGDCDLILNWLKSLCGDCEATYAFVLRWLAYPLQNVGAKMDTALVVSGTYRSGRSEFFTDLMCELYGGFSMRINMSHFESHFNVWASNKLYINYIELFEVGLNLKHFKELLTSPKIEINQKFKAPREEINKINLVILLEEESSRHSEFQSNRFVLLNPNSSSLGYESQLKKQVNGGGTKAFFYYLLNLDLTGFNQHSCLTKPTQPFAIA